MGKIKRLIIAYEDATKTPVHDTDEKDFWHFVRSQGGRLGLTDEQMDEIEDAGGDHENR